MLVTCRQMQDIEQRAFAAGVSAAALMEQAGQGIAAEVQRFHPQPGSVVLYLGQGHNAGDALVAGRELQKLGWQLLLRLSGPKEALKELPARHLETLAGVIHLANAPREPWPRPWVLLDGLVGLGSCGELRPELRVLAEEMNQLRREQQAFTVAMDLPSGLNGDSGEVTPGTVQADLTVTVAFAKRGLVADAATNHVGRLALVPLPALEATQTEDSASLLTPELLRGWLPRRNFDFHKGQAGRIGVLAGSPGFLGAAVLACGGALRAGAGMVTLLVREAVYPLLASALPPEVMVKVIQDEREVLEMNWDALAIGPGLGFAHESAVREVILAAQVPTVVDADAITMLARQASSLPMDFAGPRLLTPHPGEMERLRPRAAGMSRRDWAVNWAADHPGHSLLLKGARTVIATAGEPVLYNTTGHPGMATGGMGDVLTGVLVALMGQGVAGHTAAGLGAWAAGRAAEKAALDLGCSAVLPSDVVTHLGSAFREIA